MKYEFAIVRTYGDGFKSVGQITLEDCSEANRTIKAGAEFADAVRFEENYPAGMRAKAALELNLVKIELVCRPIQDWTTIRVQSFGESK